MDIKYSLSDVCEYRKGKVNLKDLNLNTYISTEKMLPNKQGVIKATALPNVAQTKMFKKGDTLVSNIRPYFKKFGKPKMMMGVQMMFQFLFYPSKRRLHVYCNLLIIK